MLEYLSTTPDRKGRAWWWWWWWWWGGGWAGGGHLFLEGGQAEGGPAAAEIFSSGLQGCCMLCSHFCRFVLLACELLQQSFFLGLQ